MKEEYMDNNPYNNPPKQPEAPVDVAQEPTVTHEPMQPVAPLPVQPVAPPPAYVSAPVGDSVLKPRSRLAALLLAHSFGIFGVHQYYLGNDKQGRLRLILAIVGIFTSFIIIGSFVLLGLYLWAAVDFFRLAFGSAVDGNGQPLLDDPRDKKWAKVIGIVVCVLVALYVVLLGLAATVAYTGLLEAFGQ